MIKILWGVLVMSFLVLVGLIGFVVGDRVATKRESTKRMLEKELTTTPSGLSFRGLEAEQGLFCAIAPCTTFGIRAQIKSYNPASKEISLRTDRGDFGVYLTDSTVVDNDFGSGYFEQTFEQGDIIVVIVEQDRPQTAREVYFGKTHAIGRKEKG